jgi:hypothetical protein
MMLVLTVINVLRYALLPISVLKMEKLNKMESALGVTDASILVRNKQ